MELSTKQIDTSLPVWEDYLPLLHNSSNRQFADCDRLTALLKTNLCSRSGHRIRFVPSDQLADEPYERRIYNSGQISTRPNNWHDLFNALVWAKYPAIKVAMNSCHFHAWSEQKSGRRGKLRDALTLFDECGVIVYSANKKILRALSERRWKETFLDERFRLDLQLSVCGHAILEKYLSPYKSMTAKALLLHVTEDFMLLPKTVALRSIDVFVAKQLLDEKLLDSPASLGPLPLAGVPGWWSPDEQSSEFFYDDLQVFRPAPAQLTPAPISQMS